MKSQISVLKNSLSGDLLDGKFDNGRYSTDASIYQIMPEAVILPKNIEDIKKTIQFPKSIISRYYREVAARLKMVRRSTVQLF